MSTAPVVDTIWADEDDPAENVDGLEELLDDEPFGLGALRSCAFTTVPSFFVYSFTWTVFWAEAGSAVPTIAKNAMSTVSVIDSRRTIQGLRDGIMG